MKSNIVKIIILAAIFLYVVSPVDLCVGPIDDIIVAALGLIANKVIPDEPVYEA